MVKGGTKATNCGKSDPAGRREVQRPTARRSPQICSRNKESQGGWKRREVQDTVGNEVRKIFNDLVRAADIILGRRSWGFASNVTRCLRILKPELPYG